jgi:rhamnulokinase
VSVVAAVDLGAESGRVVSGTFTGSRIDLQVVRRFQNSPLDDNGRSRWDIDGLWAEIAAGLGELGSSKTVSSVGVDAWGVDFGLYRDGALIEPPLTYRDQGRREGFAAAQHRWGPAQFHDATGTQILEIYAVYELIQERIARPAVIDSADSILMIPDIFHRLMSGSSVSEYSVASTSGMYDMAGGTWATGLLDAVGIPARLLPEVVESGTDLGRLRLDAEIVGLTGTRVITPASHDTASAILAIPGLTSSTMFISSGTWSLTGVVRPRPIIGSLTRQRHLTNEGGYARSTHLLENVVGLWVLQESRRQWQREGAELSYEDLVELAAAEQPLLAFVDLAEPDFVLPGDMPARVRAACKRHAMPVPESYGAVARVVIDSLALAYRLALDNIEAVTGDAVTDIAVVGGGVRNELLQRATASATGRAVTCWSPESSALGNIAAQLISLGELSGVDDAWRVIEASVPSRRFEPEPADGWDAAAEWLADMRLNSRTRERDIQKAGK